MNSLQLLSVTEDQSHTRLYAWYHAACAGLFWSSAHPPECPECDGPGKPVQLWAEQ